MQSCTSPCFYSSILPHLRSIRARVLPPSFRPRPHSRPFLSFPPSALSDPPATKIIHPPSLALLALLLATRQVTELVCCCPSPPIALVYSILSARPPLFGSPRHSRSARYCAVLCYACCFMHTIQVRADNDSEVACQPQFLCLLSWSLFPSVFAIFGSRTVFWRYHFRWPHPFTRAYNRTTTDSIPSYRLFRYSIALLICLLCHPSGESSSYF